MPTVEERLAALEARLSVEPRVLTPPITVGELTNVPAPGSQLAAQWAQDISSRVVQRFPNVAALKAWAAPVGAFAVQTDNGVVWRRIAAGWSQQTPWQGRIGGTGVLVSVANQSVTVATVTIPADPGPRVVATSGLIAVQMSVGATGWANLSVDGVLTAQAIVTHTGGNALDYTLTPMSTNDVPVNKPVAVVLEVSTNVAFALASHGEYWRSRLDATVWPRGA